MITASIRKLFDLIVVRRGEVLLLIQKDIFQLGIFETRKISAPAVSY